MTCVDLTGLVSVTIRAVFETLARYYSLVVVARYAFNIGERACREELADLMVQKRYRTPIIDPSSLVREGPRARALARGVTLKTKTDINAKSQVSRVRT